MNFSYDNEYIGPLKGVRNLADKDSADLIQIAYEDVLQEGSPDDCIELAAFISDALKKDEQAVKQKPGLYEYYEKIWLEMVFKGFIALSNQDQNDVLQQKIVPAVKNGIDLDIVVKEYAEAFTGDPQDAKDFLAVFAADLKQNQEPIGETPIEIGGKKYFPQIKYWLQDYLSSPAASAKRSSIDRLNYINQSPNVRRLTQIQRQYLLAVLKFFDDLINPPRVFGPSPRKAVAIESAAEAVETPSPEIKPSINIDQRLEDLKHRVEK